jgi:hypothetical protein
MFCCFRKLAGMLSENSLRISPPLPKQSPNISPFTKGGRGDFHSRRVMVETETVMEKIYRVVAERAGM